MDHNDKNQENRYVSDLKRLDQSQMQLDKFRGGLLPVAIALLFLVLVLSGGLLHGPARFNLLLGLSASLDEVALDKYSFTRDAFLQRRRNAVYDGEPPEEE